MIEECHVMTREALERHQRGIYSERINGSVVTFNRVQLAPVPARDEENARRRLLTVAGIAKEKK